MSKRVRDSADIQSEIDHVTRQIDDADAQVRKAEDAVQSATSARDEAQAKVDETAEQLKCPDISEQERSALVAELQMRKARLITAQKDLERLSKREEQLREEELQLREEKLQLHKRELQLREEKLQLLKEEEQLNDPSSALAEQLLGPDLPAPPEVDALYNFMTTPPAAPIPVWGKLPSAPHEHFTAAKGDLASAFNHSLSGLLVQGSTEMFTVNIENTVVVSLLVALDVALPDKSCIGLVVERDQQDSSSMIAVTSPSGSSLRPDGVLRDQAGGRLLAKWEDKAQGLLHEAVNDLHKKTAIWTPLYYGNIKYLPCFAAAGAKLQFYAILAEGGLTTTPHPMSPTYDLTKPTDRARAVMATVKFYQLLKAQRACYPQYVLPAAQERSAKHPIAGFTRSVYFRTDELTLRKRVVPWERFAAWCGVSLSDMQRLYRATVGQQGLVHAVRGPSDEKDNTYSVDLAPVGLRSGDALPRNEMEARDMIHGLLHGLAALHEAGFVHRDLRWDNVACCAREPRRWFLIDLECSAAADAEVPTGFQLTGWETGVTLVNGRYTRKSDIYQLGRLVEKACERLELSDAAKEFMSALLTRPTQQRSSAARLLSNKWISCVGAACRAAGAQPGER